MRIKYYGGSLLYSNWIKHEIKKNTPWDKLVRKLITAEGNISSNHAVGFYLRDKGMPLDHLSNTIQTFLGVRLQCAQCHDHPFDKWTQKNFFEMAAFTYPVINSGGIKKYGKAIDGKALKKLGLNTSGPYLNELRRNIDMGAFVTGKPLKFPHDYQYDDAAPESVVAPKLPFSKKQVPQGNSERLEHFAHWMTSPDNPLFTRSTANRLWKRAMGEGVFEPVDDIKDNMLISNKALLDTLENALKDCHYDLRKFQSIVFKTKACQRQSSSMKNGLFNGPQLRRMTAEQVWDSYCNLNVPDLDIRPNTAERLVRLYYQEAKRSAKSSHLTKLSNKEYNEKIVKASGRYARHVKEESELYKKLIQEKDNSEKKLLNRKIGDLKQRTALDIDKIVIGAETRHVLEMPSYKYMSQTIRNILEVDFIDLRGDDGRWDKYSKDYVRSSIAGFPVKSDHFMRIFGSSDYELIDNFSRQPTVTQKLLLLNGLKSFDERENFLLNKLNGKSPGECVDIIFISILSRIPTAGEKSFSVNFLENDSKSNKHLIRALLNTKSFIFY